MLRHTGHMKKLVNGVHHYNPTSGQFKALPDEEQGVSAIPLRHI